MTITLTGKRRLRFVSSDKPLGQFLSKAREKFRSSSRWTPIKWLNAETGNMKLWTQSIETIGKLLKALYLLNDFDSLIDIPWEEYFEFIVELVTNENFALKFDPDDVGYECIHDLPNGDEIIYRIYLNNEELEHLRKSSPVLYDDLGEFVKNSKVFLGLVVNNLPDDTIAKKVIPSYLRKVYEYAQIHHNWKPVFIKTSLSHDSLGVA